MHSFNNNKTLFILNPNAGIDSVASCAKQLDKFRDEFDYSTFSDKQEFCEFMKSHKDDYEIFIAVGGDGTVNSVASEILNSGKILGVLPLGSGNGFAREMGFKKRVGPLINDIRRKEFFETDVLFINDMLSINVSGIGIDSIVSHKFHSLNNRGSFNYGIAALLTMHEIKPFNVSLTIGNEHTEDNFLMVSLANSRQFGNNALVAPMAQPDDGLFNIVMVRPFPKILLPLFAIRLLTGTLKESKYIRYIESGEKAIIRAGENRVHIDGEPLVIDGEMTVLIKKNALKVLKSSFNRRQAN
jgi:diacylglycerol kinase (ATP)